MSERDDIYGGAPSAAGAPDVSGGRDGARVRERALASQRLAEAAKRLAPAHGSAAQRAAWQDAQVASIMAAEALAAQDGDPDLARAMAEEAQSLAIAALKAAQSATPAPAEPAPMQPAIPPAPVAPAAVQPAAQAPAQPAVLQPAPASKSAPSVILSGGGEAAAVEGSRAVPTEALPTAPVQPAAQAPAQQTDVSRETSVPVSLTAWREAVPVMAADAPVPAAAPSIASAPAASASPAPSQPAPAAPAAEPAPASKSAPSVILSGGGEAAAVEGSRAVPAVLVSAPADANRDPSAALPPVAPLRMTEPPAPATPAPAATPKPPHKFRTACIALTCLLALMVGLVLAAWFGLFKLPDPVQERLYLLPDPHAQAGALNAADVEVPPGGFQLVLAQLCTMEAGSLDCPVQFENPAANAYSARLVLEVDGEEVARSGMVAPGSYLGAVRLDHALPAGEHEARAVVLVYSGATQVNALASNVTIRVK